MMNPWHDVPIGKKAPEIVNAIIEIPQNNRAKYELDKETGLLRLDRILYSNVYYPANYGFLPTTYCDDDDPLDILVLSQATLQSLCLVSAKVIGVMQMLDSGEKDDKIISVANDDMSVNHINDVNDLPNHFIREMTSFFEDYKKLEHKTVVVEDFQDKSLALDIVNKALEDYKKKFGK